MCKKLIVINDKRCDKKCPPVFLILYLAIKLLLIDSSVPCGNSCPRSLQRQEIVQKKQKTSKPRRINLFASWTPLSFFSLMLIFKLSVAFFQAPFVKEKCSVKWVSHKLLQHYSSSVSPCVFTCRLGFYLIANTNGNYTTTDKQTLQVTVKTNPGSEMLWFLCSTPGMDWGQRCCWFKWSVNQLTSTQTLRLHKKTFVTRDMKRWRNWSSSSRIWKRCKNLLE